jgi:hypothetical protein
MAVGLSGKTVGKNLRALREHNEEALESWLKYLRGKN